ncbi:EKC/KEOPS complex subunit BUD32 [Abortiporus biennis]
MRLPPLWFSCSPSPFTISEHSPTKPMSSSSSQRRAYKRLPRLRRSSRRVETSDEDTTISSTDEAIDTSRLPDNRQHEFTPLPDGSNNGHDDETTLNAESLDQVSALPKFPDTRQRKILDRPIGPQELSVGSKSSQSGAKSTRSKKPVTPNPNDKVRANLAKQAQSTPSQKNMRESSQSADGRFLDSAVKGYIKGHFSSVVHREYPILDFVRFAWDFTPEDIPAGDYDIPMEYVKGYCLAKKDDNQHGERASCIWLSKILDHLHDALPDNPSNGAQFINVRDRLVIGNFAKLKPDFSRSEKEDIDDEEHWEDMTSFAEVKHRRPLDLPASQDEPTLRIDLSSLLNKEQPEEVDSDEETEEVDEEPEVYEEPASPTTPVKRKRVNTPLPSSTESSKRRKNEDGSAGAPAIKPKRRATTSLTEHEVQVIKYANELQCHGVRNYSTGIFFDNQWISLWYIDSMGIVKSQPFMFPQEPHYLLLVVAAMKAASLPRLGVSPLIDYSHPKAKFGSYEHTFLQLPKAENEEGKTIIDSAKLRFPIDVQENRRLLNTYGAIGRATTVVPILPPQLSATSNTSAESCEDMGEKYLVTKISWPEERRNSEDGYIRAIRKTMKEHPDAKHYVKNIVKVKYSLTLKRDAEKLLFPRGRWNFEEQSEPRVFRLLVLVCYEPLQNVNSVEEFKKVFRDVVIAHHWVFTVAKILHRDLSATNLMVQRIGKEINGILADFDLAVGESKEAQDEEIRRLRGLDSDSTPPSQRPGRVTSMEINPVREKAQIDKKCQKMRYRTGTGPFMAIEVLKLTPTPIHVYRYDLESFFYVLVWFCAGFNPKKNTLSSIDDWRTPSFVQIAKKQKSIHQTSNQLRHRLCQHASNIRARVKDISDRKAKLRILKDDAFLSSREKREQRRNLNRSIEESVLEVESLKDKRKKLATFENFMAKLKVDISPPPPSASTETEESDDDYDKFADLDEDSLGND